MARRVREAAHAVGVRVEDESGYLGFQETGTAGEEDGIGAEARLATTCC